MDGTVSSSPLVTLTLTTDQVAMSHAGLMLLRRMWGTRMLHAVTQEAIREAGNRTAEITAFIEQLSSSVSEEQGRELIRSLVKEMTNR